jgi:hypothetical protein
VVEVHDVAPGGRGVAADADAAAIAAQQPPVEPVWDVTGLGAGLDRVLSGSTSSRETPQSASSRRISANGSGPIHTVSAAPASRNSAS